MYSTAGRRQGPGNALSHGGLHLEALASARPGASLRKMRSGEDCLVGVLLAKVGGMMRIAPAVALSSMLALAGCAGHAMTPDDGASGGMGDGAGGSAGGSAGDLGNGGSDDGGSDDGGGGTGGDGGAPAPVTEYAPYFYTWGWGSSAYAFSSLAQMKQQGGPSAVTLAFVLSGGGCTVSTDIQDNLTDVNAFIAAGGHVKASFGGADGTYLENACSDATSLASAISGFVDATGITDLDFDIEQGTTSSNATINARRASALATVQASKHIRVAFTLPVNPDGLDNLGLDIVKAALAAGVKVSFVNVMTMDYGNGTNLGTTPIASVDATAKQLQALIAGLSLDAAYRMVGTTAMLGHNDDTEVFSLDNAKTLIAYAKQKQLGLVSFWAIQRDEKCPSGVDLDVCTGVNASTFQFHQIFDGVNQ
jgi:chitinase